MGRCTAAVLSAVLLGLMAIGSVFAGTCVDLRQAVVWPQCGSGTTVASDGRTVPFYEESVVFADQASAQAAWLAGAGADWTYDGCYTPIPNVPGVLWGASPCVSGYVLASTNPNVASWIWFLWCNDPTVHECSAGYGNSCSSGVGKDADKSKNVKPNFDNAFSMMEYVGSSVNLGNGNLYHPQEVGPLTFSYNSLDYSSGPLGRGWTHSFDLSISSNSDGSLYFKGSDGDRTWFGLDSQGLYHADAKSGDTCSIQKNTDGSYIRKTRYGTTYTFNASGTLTGIVDMNGNATTLTYSGNDLAGITDPMGRTVRIGASGGKIVSITDFSGNVYSISYSGGCLSSISDPLGNTWTYSYNTDGSMAEKTDPSGNTTSYTYDPNTGMLISSTDPDGMVKKISYDTTNSITSVTEKDGGVWIHKYDSALDAPLEVTDPLGNKTSYSYDSNRNLLSKTYPDVTSLSFTYDARGNVTSQTDPLGQTTTVTYDGQDRVTSITDPKGGSTLYAYDGNGNLASYTDQTGAMTQIQRDVSGVSAPLKGSITSITDPLGHKFQYAYDQYNNILSMTDPTGVVTGSTHDISGNVLSRTDPGGNTTTFSYDANGELTDLIDPMGNMTSLAYDKNGNVSSVTDALNNTSSYSYNFKGQPTLRKDALLGTTIFAYGKSGCATCSGGGEKLTSLTDQMGAKTTFAYDKRGLLTSETDPLLHVTSFNYDALGRPVSQTDRNGNTLAYTYTLSGNLASITYPDTTSITNTYDSLNRLTRMQDPIGVSSYNYDGAGRLTSFTDPQGFTLSYTYDAAGNLIDLTYPDGSLVAYTYDASNRLASVTNWLNQTASYAYDQTTGMLASFTNFNGIMAAYTYDTSNRLITMGDAVSNYQFTLDGNGNRIQSVDNEPLTATPASGTTSYGYDTQNCHLTSTAALNYSYDNEGQLASAGPATYTFDYAHRLSGIGTATQFSYDGRGNRLSATRRGITTRYIYDPWGNLMAEADGSNQITRKYVYGKGLFAMATSGALYCYHFNATGSTTALTDMNQIVVNKYAYDPFGAVLNQVEAVPQSFKFVGKYGVMAEPEGLYYMRARYYDPSVGRFISEDPIGFAGGDTNLYGYCLSNPINFIDPLGLRLSEHYDYSGSDDLNKLNQILNQSPRQRLQIALFVAQIVEILMDLPPMRIGGGKGTVPEINWGQQEKHFPGHNSYTPGRSTMTCDPTGLAEKAGTGQQVGSDLVGLPGSKERVDFGETIGTYIDQEGNAFPTTKGIIHYGKDGIHIVPARP